MFNVAEKLGESSIVVIKEEVFNINKEKEYVKIFEYFKNKGAIRKETKFKDKIWILTDTLKNYPANYTLNEVIFAQQNKTRKFEFEASDLENALKFFTLIKLRNRDVSTVRQYVSDIKKGLRNTDFYSIEKIKSFRREVNENKNSCIYMRLAISTIEFLDFFDSLQIDEKYYGVFENWIELGFNKKIRDLPTFTSYFKVADKINEFIQDATDDEKFTYFPVILWWKITTCIPMRVTEFTITPYNCISNEEGKYILTLMKTTEKGRSADYEHNHDLELSYIPKKFEVNKAIYDLINEYKLLVDKYDDIDDFYGEGVGTAGERKYLLSLRGYIKSLKGDYQKRSAKRFSVIDYLSWYALNRLLKNFHESILKEKYKMNVLDRDKKKNIGISDIEELQLLDTRHFSIINLIMQDVSPIIVKELAGHSNIHTTYGYFNHLENYVENYTYHLAKRYAKHNTNKPVLNLNSLTTSNAKTLYYKGEIESNNIKHTNAENGWCIYDKEDFIKCAEYEFHCSKGCEFYIPKDNDNYIDKAIVSNKEEIRTAIEVIKELIKDRKIIINFEVKYKTEMSKVKSCVEQNAKIINEHMI